MIIVYASIALIAVSFFILVIYLARTLTALHKNLSSVATTMDNLQKQLEGITSETEEILKKTNQLAEDIQEKSQSLNKVVDSISNVGSSIGKFNSTIKSLVDQVEDTANEKGEKVVQAVQWGNAAIELWQRFKSKRQH